MKFLLSIGVLNILCVIIKVYKIYEDGYIGHIIISDYIRTFLLQGTPFVQENMQVQDTCQQK